MSTAKIRNGRAVLDPGDRECILDWLNKRIRHAAAAEAGARKRWRNTGDESAVQTAVWWKQVQSVLRWLIAQAGGPKAGGE